MESVAGVSILTIHRATANSRFVIALLLLLVVGTTVGARNALEPMDTSSPRATFGSFLALTEEAAGRLSLSASIPRGYLGRFQHRRATLADDALTSLPKAL